MNLLSNDNTLIWFIFTIYAVSALFVVPNVIDLKSSTIYEDIDGNALQFASRLVLRIALILPMLSIITNTI